MSKRLNEKFLKTFIELDKLCCEKFGVATGGVTEYINRLNNARFAPDRDIVLPRLVKYRNIRNLFAHEPGAVRKSEEVVKEDVVWLSRFRLDLQKKRDPISKYLRKARRFARARRIKRAAVISLVVLLVLAIGIIVFAILNH
ncbi:MAG: hypothetical protein IKV43_03435 [Clostridia bacterium]|nr:hypothetical protein [Clostridia bacterium]